MPQLQEHSVKNISKTPLSAAVKLAEALAVSAVERDRQAGLPTEEVHALKTSGLLPLVVPRQYGELGATWGEAFKVVQMLAAAEGSIGQLYANQLILSVASHTVGTLEQAERYYRATAQHHLFWGNAFNTRDTRLKITPEGDHYRANGIKTFGTGTAVADLRVFSAIQDGVDYPIVFILPKDRKGITYNDDWDNMGQRRTASGSFTFQNVLVTSDEILGPPPYPGSGFASVLFVVNQLAKTHIYLGIAEGALEAAKSYTITQTRPWITSGVDQASQDPYILKHYGELWMQLQAAIGLAEKAAQRVQTAWEQEWTLTPQERGEVAIPVYAAKAMASKVGLEITNRVFEMMGARSTAAKYGFDRYWRDLRTFTLHDPVDYKLRDVGNWVLNQELPMISHYS